ncbi:extra macrochaetae [Nasonia vitripennis]|uniref:BHLH domain-containing protein n=1 Tax=Nasonia vitripennis TaxID=7425 RepID=A0A7M6UVH2_NASVI|nr:extra macrochaetae [Nasonia vitripennis]
MVVSPVGGRVPATARRVLMAGGRRDLEAEEVAAYLGKLRDLVPDMPRSRKLSKLEVIQHVIRYICELETTLEKDDEQQQRQEMDIDATAVQR